MSLRPDSIYGGIYGVESSVESFDLGEGVEIRKTYAHLFSTNMMAFRRPKAERHHPGPWKSAKGGFSYDITVEIRVPRDAVISKSFDAKETIWWIATLLRLAKFPHLTVPVISNLSFGEIAEMEQEPTLTPFEIEPRWLCPNEEDIRQIDAEVLQWVKANWISGGRLLEQSPKFYTALKAFDSATIRNRGSASMLTFWGGLEQLFAPSSGELRFRVAALLASYLHPPGEKRYDAYKVLLKLYNERSTAAHTAAPIDTSSLAHTYVIMRNALVKIIGENRVPTQRDLEEMLFCVDSTSLEQGSSSKPR